MLQNEMLAFGKKIKEETYKHIAFSVTSYYNSIF